MDKKILVAYASKYGATAEIAEKIGEVLRQAEWPVDVLPVEQVKDLGPYRAVVLGSAVYIGQWRRGAVKFLKANEAALSERMVWIFSSGPAGEGDPVELLEGWRLPGAAQPIVERIHPRDVTVFHGALDMDKLNGLERWMIKNVESPVGDFRDWEAIAAWAATIADALRSAGA